MIRLNDKTADFAGYLRVVSSVLFGLSTLVSSASSSSQPKQPTIKNAAKLQYNRDIRPILAENCFACHGPDSAARKADLRLDKAATATEVRNGIAPIVPGKPLVSAIYRRITGQDGLMPPPETHKKLKPDQITLIKQWIVEGAAYEPHWAYIAPKKAPIPVVKYASWPSNNSPIDRFVLARLEQMGLKPAPAADRRTLARRVCLDLTGLPPDPADVDLFTADKSPNAYEKLVDKYLASPRYGEHRARYWLDAARYADTNGIHFDNYREIWSFRDWTINAFNANIPFNQFAVEQLAGDLLPNPSLDQLVATGFTRCNITTNEGGAIDEEYKVLYARDRTETASQVFMGSTLGCAVCHDHKFDPFTQKDFYSFSAFFNNTTQAAMDGNVKDTAPVIPVPMAQDVARFDAVKGELAEARKTVDQRKTAARADFDAWIGRAKSQSIIASVPQNGLYFSAPLNEGSGRIVQASLQGVSKTLTAAAEPGWDVGQVSEKAFQRKAGSEIVSNEVGDFEKGQAFSFAAWVKLPAGGGNGAIFSRMDDQHDYRGWDLWLEGSKVGSHIINKWPDNALKVVTRNPISVGVWHHVCVAYPGTAKAGDVRVYVDGVMAETDIAMDKLTSTIHTNVPFKIGQRFSTSGVDGTDIQDVRLYGRVLDAAEVARLAGGTRAAWLISRGAALTSVEKDETFKWWLNAEDPEYKSASEKLTTLQTEYNQILQRGTVAHVAKEMSTPPMAFVLNRGEYDKRKDKVTPATPASLPPMPADFPKNRLGLAKWIVMPENPLTARVTVNRMWQEVFGTGIVRTTGDFGVNGEIPTNQPLLDWLAVDFRENGWNVKRLIKQIVMSSTYKQSAVESPEKKRLDPENRYFSRGPRFRMDAEMIRDYALAASGLLSPKIGGPSVRTYQPDGVWEAVAIIGSNTRDYKRDSGESLYRRSLYTFWKRSAPPASLDIFNAPSRETCTVRRDRTDTPLQALVTLNDVQYVEAARNLAQRTLKEGGTSDAAKETYIAKRLLARPLTLQEQTIVERTLNELQSHYASDAADAKQLIAMGESKADPAIPAEKLAAWTMLANQLMNLDEVLNK
jgi:hypothetical protein